MILSTPGLTDADHGDSGEDHHQTDRQGYRQRLAEEYPGQQRGDQRHAQQTDRRRKRR